MVVNYLERIGSLSPNSAGFALDGGRASWIYDVGPFDLPDALVDVLGTTDTDVGDGRLKRQLPKAHPWLPWCYAERISNIQGVGKPTTFNVTESFECPLLVQQIALYPRYRLSIDFLPRPYYVLSDSNIPMTTEAWTDEDGTVQSYLSTKEFVRFTDYDVFPDADVVTAQHGMMRFRGGTANNRAFTGMPRVSIAKAVIKFRWFAIPFRYIESADSYLVRFLNHINQIDFWQWPAGSLLYKGFAVPRKWTPIVPETNPVFGTSAFTPDKLCDVELYWEYTDRKLAAAPTAPVNDNWIVAGHNLMPNYADRGFYYVSTDNPSPDLQVPLFASVPFQLLFTDPDI